MRPDIATLFTRPFWLDEWHTNLVANRPSLTEVFSDLHRGSDFGPPLVHIIAWTVARLGGTGQVTPVAARIVSLLAVLGALTFVFLILRRRFGVAAGIAGALAVASHQIVIAHAFELRFYCLWLLCAAGFAWALTVDDEAAVSRRRDILVGAFAVLLCMSHWLAVLSLGVMCLGAMASYGRAWRAGFRRVLPASAGFVAVAIASPLVFGQRASLTERSWMPPVIFRDVLGTLSMYWGGTLLILAILVILFGLLRAQTKEPLKASFRGAVRSPGIAALLSLFVLPLLMVVVSIKMPAMHTRYSITVLLAWAPLVAIAVQTSGKLVRGVLYLVMLAFFWVAFVNMTIEAARFAYSADGGRKALAEACALKVPVVFEVRHLMYPSTDGLSRKWAYCDTRFLAMSSATLDSMFPRGSYLPQFFRFENEIARLHQRVYGSPRVSAQADLDTVPRFVLVGWDDSLPIGYKDALKFGQAVFPRHRARRINEDLTLFERR